MDIDSIRYFWQNDEVEFSDEAWDRIEQREVSVEAIEQAILNGQVIEERPRSKPWPKCTVQGWATRYVAGLALSEPHRLNVACGVGDVLYVITVYWEGEQP